MIVVVGGGIVGLASAYYLARDGAEVVVLERSSPGAGSTGRAVGGIRAQFSRPVNVRLSLAAMEVWDDFEAEFGVDPGFRRTGYAFLAREPATADRLRDRVARQCDLGADVDTLSPAELRARTGVDVHPERFELATYGAGDGVADPHLALQGYLRGAREAGVEVRTDTAARDITIDGDRVVGVETDDGPIEADCVVNAAGPWARAVGNMADVDLPVSPRRRQVAVVEPERPVPETTPLTFDADRGVYFLPDREGDALVGGHFPERGDPEADPDDYSTDFELDWAAETLDRAADCAAHFGPEAGLKRGWSGLYAVTPDHSPVLERSRPGLVTAAGFSGHGFMHAPATGQVVADLVAGRSPVVDVSGLSRDRFEGDASDADAAGRREANVL